VPAAAATGQPRYTIMTPSEHIDPDKTTIAFLLYRRFMRMLFVRSR